MLKTSSRPYKPNYTPMARKPSQAATHLWDDFVQQVASYARRSNLDGVRLHERKSTLNPVSSAWYNNRAGSFR